MLDPRGRRGLLRVCKALHERRMTIVMITHHMEEAAQADRIIVFDQGSIALDGTPEQILTRAEELRQLKLELPFACELSLLLQREGLPIRTHIDTTSLKEELCPLLSIG